VGSSIGLLIVIFLLVFVWPIRVSASIGRKKGQENAWLWGFLLSWIGVLIVAAMPTPRPFQLEPVAGIAASRHKVCPDCAETVKAEAKVCRHCGHKFEPT
jgi:hypothetical protein